MWPAAAPSKKSSVARPIAPRTMSSHLPRRYATAWLDQLALKPPLGILTRLTGSGGLVAHASMPASTPPSSEPPAPGPCSVSTMARPGSHQGSGTDQRRTDMAQAEFVEVKALDDIATRPPGPAISTHKAERRHGHPGLLRNIPDRYYGTNEVSKTVAKKGGSSQTHSMSSRRTIRKSSRCWPSSSAGRSRRPGQTPIN